MVGAVVIVNKLVDLTFRNQSSRVKRFDFLNEQ